VPWVVDERIRNSRDTVLAKLRSSIELIADTERSERAIEGGTRATIGLGHEIGDRMIHDIVRSQESCRNAVALVERAISAVNQVDIMRWEEPQDQDG